MEQVVVVVESVTFLGRDNDMVVVERAVAQCVGKILFDVQVAPRSLVSVMVNRGGVEISGEMVGNGIDLC